MSRKFDQLSNNWFLSKGVYFKSKLIWHYCDLELWYVSPQFISNNDEFDGFYYNFLFRTIHNFSWYFNIQVLHVITSYEIFLNLAHLQPLQFKNLLIKIKAN